MGEDEKKFTTVSVPAPLFKKIEERIKGTIIFLLRPVLQKLSTYSP